jgi:hypothetical protein
MAQRPKAKPKSKGRKGISTDKAQSARFIETARNLEVEEDGHSFKKAFDKLLPPKKRFIS